jgi:hypothetical protein
VTKLAHGFPDSAKNAQLLKINPGRSRGMGRLSFALLITTALVLTAYFGAAAWRVSDDSQMEITGHIRPAAK